MSPRSAPEALTATDRLFETDPFERSPEARALFVESFRETAWVHYEGNEYFRALWRSAGLRPADIRDEADLDRVPPIMVHLFKERELISAPKSEIVLTLTSSGTGGQKSRQFLSARSLERVKRLAYRIHASLGITSDDEVEYVCFTYDPRIAQDLGTAFTDELLTGFTRKREVYYAFQWDESRQEFFFNEEGTLQAIHRFAKGQLPVRILGFPAFLHQLITKHGLRMSLPHGSWVQTGGGWKGLADQEIPKADFRRLVSESLGIPVAQIRDLFGMVEHGIPYVDCERGRLHIPNYARVRTRSPDGRRLLAEGERGLLELLCTYNDSYPAMALLTTDWGRVGCCDCKWGGPTLELLGRAGVHRMKGCALQAVEMLK